MSAIGLFGSAGVLAGQRWRAAASTICDVRGFGGWQRFHNYPRTQARQQPLTTGPVRSNR